MASAGMEGAAPPADKVLTEEEFEEKFNEIYEGPGAAGASGPAATSQSLDEDAHEVREAGLEAGPASTGGRVGGQSLVRKLSLSLKDALADVRVERQQSSGGARAPRTGGSGTLQPPLWPVRSKNASRAVCLPGKQDAELQSLIAAEKRKKLQLQLQELAAENAVAERRAQRAAAAAVAEAAAEAVPSAAAAAAAAGGSHLHQEDAEMADAEESAQRPAALLPLVGTPKAVPPHYQPSSSSLPSPPQQLFQSAGQAGSGAAGTEAVEIAYELIQSGRLVVGDMSVKPFQLAMLRQVRPALLQYGLSGSVTPSQLGLDKPLALRLFGLTRSVLLAMRTNPQWLAGLQEGRGPTSTIVVPEVQLSARSAAGQGWRDGAFPAGSGGKRKQAETPTPSQVCGLGEFEGGLAPEEEVQPLPPAWRWESPATEGGGYDAGPPGFAGLRAGRRSPQPSDVKSTLLVEQGTLEGAVKRTLHQVLRQWGMCVVPDSESEKLRAQLRAVEGQLARMEQSWASADARAEGLAAMKADLKELYDCQLNLNARQRSDLQRSEAGLHELFECYTAQRLDAIDVRMRMGRWRQEFDRLGSRLQKLDPSCELPELPAIPALPPLPGMSKALQHAMGKQVGEQTATYIRSQVEDVVGRAMEALQDCEERAERRLAETAGKRLAHAATHAAALARGQPLDSGQSAPALPLPTFDEGQGENGHGPVMQGAVCGAAKGPVVQSRAADGAGEKEKGAAGSALPATEKPGSTNPIVTTAPPVIAGSGDL